MIKPYVILYNFILFITQVHSQILIIGHAKKMKVFSHALIILIAEIMFLTPAKYPII